VFDEKEKAAHEARIIQIARFAARVQAKRQKT
jgi:hypothetical protein